MKRITGFFAAILCIAVIVAVQSCQSTKSSTATKMLKFNFEKGKGYDYEMIVNTDQQVNGAKQQMDMSAYYSMDVTEDDGNLKSIRTRFGRFKMNMELMGMKLEVDTEKPFPAGNEADAEKNPLAMVNRLLGAVKNQQFLMKVNAEGKILEVTGFQDMARSIADSFGLEGEKKQEMIQSFNQQFNEKSIKEQFEKVLYIFPNKEVKIGDSWEKKTLTSGPMVANYNSTYIVKDIEGDMVTLEEVTKIESDQEQMKLKGEQTGTLVVDSKTGLVVTADMDISMATSGGGTKIDMKGKTKIRGKAR